MSTRTSAEKNGDRQVAGAGGDRGRAPRTPVQGMHGPWSDLRRELERSRRFGHSFAVVRVPRQVKERPRLRLWRGRSSRTAVDLPVRSVDCVWNVGDWTYVLMPETSRSQAENAIARLSERFPHSDPREAALAVFPDDGLTERALLAVLDREALAPAARLVPSEGSAVPVTGRPEAEGT